MEEKSSHKDQSGSHTELGPPRDEDGAKPFNGGGTGGANPPASDAGPPTRGNGKHKHPHQV